MVACAISISSCKKIEVPLDKIKKIEIVSPEQQALVNESKIWYETQRSKVGKTMSINSSNGSSNPATYYIGNPDWSGVSLFDMKDIGVEGGQEIVRVPLVDYVVNGSYTSKMSPNGYRDLLLRKQSSDYFILNVIEIHPDSSYLEMRRKIKSNGNKTMRELVKNEDFTGYFLVYSPETNALMYGERRENGLPISTLTP